MSALLTALIYKHYQSKCINQLTNIFAWNDLVVPFFERSPCSDYYVTVGSRFLATLKTINRILSFKELEDFARNIL